jgi:hypothetical protein
VNIDTYSVERSDFNFFLNVFRCFSILNGCTVFEEADAESTEICSACLPKPLVFTNMTHAELKILDKRLIQMEANQD